MDLNSVLSLNSAANMSRVQYVVAAKILDTQAQQGDAAVKLIQAAGQGVEQQIAALNESCSGCSDGGVDVYA
ncbi:MAG: hypothetical protein SFY96_05850 [Planctomycetota bacterium]|nr:hypothetical protein [Planctomycetota bacterium]